MQPTAGLEEKLHHAGPAALAGFIGLCCVLWIGEMRYEKPWARCGHLQAQALWNRTVCWQQGWQCLQQQADLPTVHSRTVDGDSQERQQQGKWEHRRADRRHGRLLPAPQLLQIGRQGSCTAGSSHWPRTPLRPQQHTHSIPHPVSAQRLPSCPPLLHTGAPPHALFTIIPLVPVTHPISPNTDGLPTPQALGSPLNASCSRLIVPTWGPCHSPRLIPSCVPRSGPLLLCPQSASDGFWKSVATRVPKEPPEIRILNPYFIQEAAFTLIGLPFNNGLMGRGNIPTLGSVAVTMALHGCDEVAVAGFGYDMSTPNAPLHYYETVRMAAIKESWTHNIQREKEFLRKLVKARVITDLSSGI
ncbi:CMP-N-acetylneuraminate-beta-1,4-galactoside alpha-2,3-sialyltransferase isoform X10 [Hylobates moloch]|uniref:CMP-N-acetylneuraminate-beta-1,4-galactoside alpha-2,3-sialyltransferase isoform X10 n=1 Tax=Hylobates moloch TaxID=81572 RepID=UPI002676E5D4|nr:CMP-N-acetylneuraminate-beta-1,4-galactoside alpha-2,3-sialyltransferase isoform X10 [Hylobates moloch]